MRRKAALLLVLFLGLVCLWLWFPRSGPELRYYALVFEPRDIELRPVVLDLKATCGLEFSQIVEKYHPCAAINGTFFNNDFRPLGDVLVDGKLVNRGAYPNAVAVTTKGKIEFVRRQGSRFDWRGYRCALAAGPRLVHEGQVGIDAEADGFHTVDADAKAWRSGIGLTDKGKLLLVVCRTPVSMWRFAELMRDHGAVEAMNLDGGAACGLYHNGKTLIPARLRMTNLLLVYRRH